MNVYDFTVENAQGKEVKLSEYKGDVLMIVNTATECGFTPQYEELEKLYEKYKDQGFVILDFPCNQFGHQAPGSEEEIHQFCSTRYGVTFPQMKKIEVNGKDEIPLYKYLKEQMEFKGFDMDHPIAAKLVEILTDMDPHYAEKSDIKWNFTKFLVNREGEVVARFEPTAPLDKVEVMIQDLLEQKK